MGLRQDVYDGQFFNGIFRQLFRLDHEVRIGAGAADPNVPVSLWESTGADVVTLADGTHDGQVKIFIHETDGGSVIITPETMNGASNTTVTMLTAGDCVGFIWANAAWHLLWSTSNIEGTPLVIA